MIRRKLSVLIIGFMLFSILSLSPITKGDEPVEREDGVLENTGDWVIEDGENFSYTNKTIIINGNLTVNGTLSLTGCDLIMNRTSTTLKVNGELHLIDTNISGNSTYYYFMVYGIMNSLNSNFTDMIGSSTPPYVGGLQVYSEDVVIDGGIIYNNTRDNDYSFTGLYIQSNITVRNLTIQDNEFNVVVNGSAPEFHNCTIRSPVGVTLYMVNGASPSFIEGVPEGEKMFEDEASSFNICHLLSVHVILENGTAVPGAAVRARSRIGLVKNGITDSTGWVRNIVLINYTSHKSGGDTVHVPYVVSAKKFGLQVQKETELLLYTTTVLELILVGDSFGYSLIRGDFNGDSLLDLVVGVPGNTSGTRVPGAVFVYLNNGGLELRELNEGMADLTIEGVDGSGFGSTLAAGDIDGDGYDDLIVGAISASENGEDSGRVYFFSGSETPAWNEVEDAAFYFDGEPGSNLGKHLLVTNLNNDGFMDFVIGDNEHSYVYYGTSDPASDYTGISEVHSYATVKGIHDDTQKLLSKVQHNDNERYLVNPKKKLHIHNFTIDEIKGEITEVTLRVQYITDQYYGYNQQERNWMKVRIGDGEWMDTIRPTDHHNSEHTETFDLFANGINTLEQLEKLEIFFESWEGKQGNDHYIHFDFIHLDIVSIPPGMNHTLEPGNLSSGDVNGDGFPELIISDPADQVIYFGGPKGLSAPDALQIKEYEGNATRTDTKKGNLTLAKIGQFKNGNFDDGWDHWSFVQNSRGEKDGDLRLLENDVGDWQVSPLSGAPTGGYGTNDNNLNGRGGDSSGLLKSDPFYIADEIEEITLWHRWEVRSFDTNEGMNIKLYRASDDTALLTIAEWMATSDGQNYEETGVLNASVVDLRGETVYLAMETLGGDDNRDEGLWQIDDIDLLPSLFYENGTFISNWIMFEGNLSSYTPSWNEELNNGTVSVKFRTNTSENWSDISECVSGEKIELPTPSDNLQYRVVMTNNGSATPVVRNLGIGYLFEGQIVPLYLSTSYGKVKLGDIDGDGADDLLFLKDEGIDIHYGSANFSEDFNASNITSYYSGNVADFSFLDLERDGKDEVVVVGESIRILDFSAEAVWQRNLTASRVVWNTASDPEYHLNTGAIYFLPAYDRELRVLDIDVPVLVNPGENQSIGITLGNAGMTDALNLTLYLNITAQGYSRNFSLGFNLSSMSSGVFAFIWPVPADEGVSYTLVAEAVMEDDRVPENDNLSMMITTKRHGIRMSAPSPTASAHGGDELSYPIILNNTGTFETENVSLSLDLSLGWSGTYYYLGLPVEKILVAVSEQLTFIAFSPFDEMDDDFILNLTANAFSATTGVDLTATVLRPELVVEEVSLYRADGVQTNDTIHGVEGDVEELRIRVANQGPTYSTPFNVSIQRNDTPIQEFRHPGLDAGKDTWFSFRIVPEAGVLNITAEVDSLYEVPEMDEDNNLTEKFDIKNNTPVGDYNLTGEIRDIFGEGVENANVTLEWGNNDVILVTDENGDFSRVLTAMEYNDTMMLYINATDGNNITKASIILYSEDRGKHLILTLNQYIVEVNGPDTVSNIETGGNTSITVEVTNKGNINASFILTASKAPGDWSIEFLGLSGGKLDLSVEENAQVEVSIRASANPEHSKGYQRYFLSLFVYAEIYPEANDTFSHSIEVEPHHAMVVSVVGKNTSEARPHEELSFELEVENQGNVKDTLIPELFGYSIDEYEFNISYAVLDIGESALFTLNLTMPHLPAGDSINLSVGDEHTSNAWLTLTSLRYYSIECTCPRERAGKPGETISIPLTITNTGNLQENITITPWSPRSGLDVTGGYVLLDMGDPYELFLEVTLPSNALNQEVIPLHINLTTGEDFHLNITVNITITEVRNIDLTILNTIIIPETDFTIYHYRIEAENTGNGRNTFYFKAEGDYPHYIVLPEPITLNATEKQEITAEIIVPINRTGVVDNYLVPTDAEREFGGLNLRIRSYSPSLITDVQTYQEGEMYIFNISVMNNGTRFERLALVTGLPGEMWDGGTAKGIIELMPGENESFELEVTTPNSREYWGGELSITLNSVSGRYMKLSLHKPPIPVLGTNLPGEITFEDTLMFTGTQSYWNIVDYLWDFGDGTHDTGVTVEYRYRKAGEFTLTLTVVDDIGFTASKTLDIEVVNQNPIPIIIANPRNRTVEVGVPIKLDATHSIDRDGDIVRYLWDFGDFTGEGNWPVEEHSYSLEGDYEVELSVWDNFGVVVNTTITVHVIPKTEKPGDTSQQIEEKTKTDPLSYLPAVLTVVIVLAGAALVFHKKSFIRHIKEKIAEEQKKLKERKVEVVESPEIAGEKAEVLQGKGEKEPERGETEQEKKL